MPTAYDDEVRHAIISKLVSALLHVYDVVVRVDPDEFLVVDPRVAPSLADWVRQMEIPYLTARGFDVIQLEGEAPLPKEPDTPILTHRAFAYPNAALNKTCIVKTPTEWSGGFHGASVFPRFGPVFMLHMKRLDIGWQVDWFRHMLQNISQNEKTDEALKSYYRADQDDIRNYHLGVENRDRLYGIDAWYRHEFTTAFTEQISFSPLSGMYVGGFDHEGVLCEIIPEWRELFF